MTHEEKVKKIIGYFQDSELSTPDLLSKLDYNTLDKLYLKLHPEDETAEDVEIWGTTFSGADVISYLSEESAEKFNNLPPARQKELIQKHAYSISKGLESGIMYDWDTVMKTAIENTSLEDDIKEVKMRKTYLFAEKNSSCCLTLSAESEDSANEVLKETVIDPEGWRLEEVESEEEDEE